MAAQHQQLQYQAEAIVQQLNLVGVSIDECQRAINTINELEGVADEHEILVPIGFGASVRAKLDRPDNVVIEIGADVSIEKNLNDARTNLESRKGELDKYRENIQTQLNGLLQKMEQIKAVLSTAVNQQQSPGKQPMHGS